MEEKFIEATQQRPEGDRVIDAAMLAIDLPSFIDQIKKERIWEESDRNAITVFKTNGMSIVLIALHKGAEMTKHIAEGILSLQVLEGWLLFNTDERSLTISQGQMLTLHERIPHNILAQEESIFLLTLTTTLSTK